QLALLIPIASIASASPAQQGANGPPSASTLRATADKAPAILRTVWGEPDLQGIWTDATDTPLQRPAKYANQEFFTEVQRAELDQLRSGIVDRRATDRDANNGYNGAVFFTTKRTGARTSRIVDPPNGRTPPLTPEAQKIAAA